MKEKIYTIPVNEAFSSDCECPMCFLKKKLEAEAVDYSLGAAMMEPDYRLLSNEQGFCRNHYSMMIKKPNKLSLALVLDTHLEELRKKMQHLEKNVASMQNEKNSLFKKSSSDSLKEITETLNKTENSCVICDKINHTMQRYIEVVFYLWKNDSAFKDKLVTSKGFCLPHFNELCSAAAENLDKKQAYSFIRLIYDKQLNELERIQNDIHRFTLKFDYRNKDMELGTAVDAPVRTIEKISGYLAGEEQ